MGTDLSLPLADVHEVHNSERMSFRGCRRRWNWVFQERWYPPITAKPLEFGVAFHKAMEEYYNPETWEWDHDLNALAAIGAFKEACEQQRRKYIDYLRASGQEAMQEEAETDYNERVELGLGMLKYFFERVAPKEDQGITPIRAEIAFSVPVLDPKFYEDLTDSKSPWDDLVHTMSNDAALDFYQLRCNSPLCATRHKPNAPVVFAGRFDLLLEDEYSDLWILDWKTAARLATEAREGFLQVDNAITAYCWAMFAMGARMRGFLYHEQKKTFPQPPTRNTRPYMGKMYSCNKQQSTSVEIFTQTVKEGDAAAYEAGLYNEFIDYLKAVEAEPGGGYYARFQVHRSHAQLLNAGKNLSLETLDMIDTPRIYPQPGRFSCDSCAFRQPCIGQDCNEDYLYTLASMFEKRDHYWTREEPSTETKGGE
jgi:hypothetical protein